MSATKPAQTPPAREHGDLAVDGLELVERREDEDGRLAHAALGLADDVHAEHGLGDALVLHLGRVLEAAVDDRAEAFGLEDEVAEARGVDADVVALLRVLVVGGRLVDDVVVVVVHEVVVGGVGHIDICVFTGG